MSTKTSKCIEGAREQLFILDYAEGEQGCYVWGFYGDYDVTVRLPRESYRKICEFLAEGEGNDLDDIDGVLASELSDPEDERYIPMGAPVSVGLWFQDRTSDESPWFFDIRRKEAA